jgi:hypothetical protein
LEGEQDQLLSDQSLKSHPVRTGQLRSDFHNRVRIVADSFTRVCPIKISSSKEIAQSSRTGQPRIASGLDR